MPVTPIDALRAMSHASGATLSHLDTRRFVRRSLSNEANLRSYVLNILNVTIIRAARELAGSDEEATNLLELLKREATNPPKEA